MKKIYSFIIIIGLIMIGGFLGLRYFLKPNTKNVYALPADKKKNYSDLDLRPLITSKLKQIIKEGSDGLYDLSLDSISIDLLNSQIKIFNASLNSNNKLIDQLDKQNKLPDEIYNINTSSIIITGVNADDFITSKTIDLDLIRIINPDIKVVKKNRPYNAAQRAKDEEVSLHQKISSFAKSISIKKLIIDDGTLTATNAAKNKTKKLNELSIQLQNILIDSSTEHSKSRFLFAESGTISTNNYAFRTADSLYLFTAKKISISAPSQTMNISGILFTPRVSKQAFQKGLKTAKERYDASISNIKLQNVDWWAFFNEDVFTADKMELNGGKVNVYLDRTKPPPASKVGNFPHQLLSKLSMPVYIKKFDFNNVDLLYEEYNPASGKKGEVKLDNINGTASNITNINKYIRQNDKMTVNTQSTLLQTVPLNVSFTFDLDDNKNGNFTAQVNAGAVDGLTLNKMAKPLGLFSIDKGNIQKLSASISGTNRMGKGRVLLLYNDLNISVLKKDEDKKSGLKEKEIIGFFANTFVIKDENPKKGEKPRVANVTFKRDVQTGFFNLAWKTVLAGILESIGANPKLAERKK